MYNFGYYSVGASKHHASFQGDFMIMHDNSVAIYEYNPKQSPGLLVAAIVLTPNQYVRKIDKVE
jgi:hypothetical protein